MKIAFVYSENNIIYNKYFQDLVESIKELTCEMVECDELISKVSRKKYDLYVVISNTKEEFEANLPKVKDKPLLITRNLNSIFIGQVIDNVKDILYSEGKTDNIARRILYIAGK